MNTVKTALILPHKGEAQLTQPIAGWFNRVANQFEQARFGWMTIGIIAQSCLGSIACMYILENDASDAVLASCAAVTMGSNALFIAQAPAKACLTAFGLSILTNLVFIVCNL